MDGSLRTNFPCGDSSFQVYIIDDSNAPDLLVGYSVVIDRERAPLPGKFCLVIGPEGPAIGRYRPRKGHIEIVPVNGHWPTLHVSADAIVGPISEITIPQ